MKRNAKKGFTLVELVIVIAVIAILAAVLIPTFGGIIDKANASAASQAAANAYKEAYALDWADGVLDGKEGQDEIKYVAEGEDGDGNVTPEAYGFMKNCTYTVPGADGEDYTFVYDDSKWTASIDCATGKWTVAKKNN